ncbi:hypothetical protein D9757_012728 [Collybiopsis confluens]|uniref:Uncharacterized protein n=1 Tax=Collybiopsis confluens TaxID=2823264 RepID=A0A8H5D3K0_9AGAR|nr:hypothetical protein D9757_012728 [Collybiopsis confluens]
MSPPHRADDRHSMIRASVLDAFVQLGAFDKNNPLTKWVFEENGDPGSNGFADMSNISMELELEENTPDRGRAYGSLESSMVATVGQPTSESSTIKQKFGMFRSRSKSRVARKHAKHSELAVRDVEEQSLSPSVLRSKSRTRRLFSRPKLADTTAPSTSNSTPASLSTSAHVISLSNGSESTIKKSGTVAQRKGIRGVFSRRQWKNDEEVENYIDDAEGWTYVAPLTPGAFVDEGWPATVTAKTDQSDGGSSTKITEHSFYPLSKRFSFAIPRTTLDSRFSAAKRRISHRPPSLQIESTPAISTSLPPSPFILVALEDTESAAGPDTPYVLFTPVERHIEQSDGPSRPVYPISVSKTIRRSMILDSFDVGNGPKLRRSISLQDARPISFVPDNIDAKIKPSGPDVPRLGRTPSKRGRDAPFPPRPVLPLPLSISMLGDARNVRLSMDARASVLHQRYRRGNGNT